MSWNLTSQSEFCTMVGRTLIHPRRLCALQNFLRCSFVTDAKFLSPRTPNLLVFFLCIFFFVFSILTEICKWIIITSTKLRRVSCYVHSCIVIGIGFSRTFVLHVLMQHARISFQINHSDLSIYRAIYED